MHLRSRCLAVALFSFPLTSSLVAQEPAATTKPVPVADEAVSEEVQTAVKLANELANATVTGDYAKVVDATYPSLVTEMGGRENAIKVTTNAIQKMQADGFVIQSLTVGKPGPMLSEGTNSFVVLPTALEMTVPRALLKSKSYLLAVSNDKGKSWKFVEGAGLAMKEMRDRVLPTLPATLKLPEPTQPEVIPQ